MATIGKNHGSLRLVVDASVLQAAGNKEGISANCRKLLKDILDI